MLCHNAELLRQFLDTKPYDFTAPETFYSNESECTAALAGVYYTLVYEKVYGNNYSCMISNVDDLSYYQRQSGQLASQVYGNDHNPGNQHVWGTWETLYKGINNANVFLENVDKADMDESVKTRMKGEAKFLRAYFSLPVSTRLVRSTHPQDLIQRCE